VSQPSCVLRGFATSGDLRRCPRLTSSCRALQAVERIEATKVAGKGRFEDAPLRRKDGHEILVDISATVLDIGGRQIYQSIVRDITEQKRAEEALHESEQRFRSLVETTSDWVWAVDRNGVYIYASPKVKDLLGYEPEDVIGKTPFDLMPAKDAKRVFLHCCFQYIFLIFPCLYRIFFEQFVFHKFLGHNFIMKGL